MTHEYRSVCLPTTAVECDEHASAGVFSDKGLLFDYGDDGNLMGMGGRRKKKFGQVARPIAVNFIYELFVVRT